MLAEIVAAGGIAAFQRVQQHLRIEQVIAHRGIGMAGPIRHGRRVGRLFLEGADAAVGIGVDDAEAGGLLQRHRQRRDGGAGAFFQMEIDHLLDVHAVDVIGAEHQHQIRAVLPDQVDVLVHRIRRALEPFLPAPHLRRHHGDEMFLQQRRQHPGLAHVFDQRLRLVLHQQIDGVDAGIDQVGEHEIDDAIARAERHGRLGTLRRQRMQARTFAAGDNHGQNLLLVHALPRGVKIWMKPDTSTHAAQRRA